MVNLNQEQDKVIPNLDKEATLSVVYSCLLFAVLSFFSLFGYLADHSKLRVIWLAIPCLLLLVLICVVASVLKVRRMVRRFGEKMKSLEALYAQKEPGSSPVYITVHCEPNPIPKYEDYTAICLNGTFVGISDGSVPMVLKSLHRENHITVSATNIRFWRLATIVIPESAGPHVIVNVHSTRNPREMMSLSRQSESSIRSPKRVYVQENSEKRIYRQPGSTPDNPR